MEEKRPRDIKEDPEERDKKTCLMLASGMLKNKKKASRRRFWLAVGIIAGGLALCLALALMTMC